MVKNKKNMIVVTGAAGFISSALVGKLNGLGHENIVVVDDFSRKIEKIYSLRYFGEENLYKTVENKLAFFKIK